MPCKRLANGHGLHCSIDCELVTFEYTNNYKSYYLIFKLVYLKQR